VPARGSSRLLKRARPTISWVFRRPDDATSGVLVLAAQPPTAASSPLVAAPPDSPQHFPMAHLIVGRTAGSSGQCTVGVFRPSPLHRAFFMISGVGFMIFVLAAAASDSPGWLVFAPCAVVVLLEGVRARVAIDVERREVLSCRAFRGSAFRMSEIENVRVPPWGPVIFTLREGAAKVNGGLWSGQIQTGLYSKHRGGSDTVAGRLAHALDVPVVSVWPVVRSEDSGA